MFEMQHCCRCCVRFGVARQIFGAGSDHTLVGTYRSTDTVLDSVLKQTIDTKEILGVVSVSIGINDYGIRYSLSLQLAVGGSFGSF